MISQLIPFNEVTKETAEEQVLIRLHMMDHELVGNLYPSILWDEVVLLRKKFKTKA